MPAPTIHFGPDTPFSAREQEALLAFWGAVESGTHADTERFLDIARAHVQRIHAIRDALETYPPVFQERELGTRQRGLATLVDLVANATDADVEMFLPTRAMLWRSLTMARLNFWRLVRYVVEEIFDEDAPDGLTAKADGRVHASVYLKMVDELLLSLAMDSTLDHHLRGEVMVSLTSLWDGTPSSAVQEFFPVLEAIWEARRTLRVSVGTMLGVSEIMKLLQAGCAPQFVDYFRRARMTKDEGMAFQEFLIGVTTEQIHDLEELLQDTGRTCLSAEEAEEALGRPTISLDDSAAGVGAYQFHRERQLQAAARRLRNLPGPKHTAEEYMLLYFLEDKLR